MIPKMSELINMKVGHGSLNNLLYFDIEGIRELFPDLRFPPEKIQKVNIGGVMKDGIQQKDIHELTPFEKNLVKLHSFKK